MLAFLTDLMQPFLVRMCGGKDQLKLRHSKRLKISFEDLQIQTLRWSFCGKASTIFTKKLRLRWLTGLIVNDWVFLLIEISCEKS